MSAFALGFALALVVGIIVIVAARIGEGLAESDAHRRRMQRQRRGDG